MAKRKIVYKDLLRFGIYELFAIPILKAFVHNKNHGFAKLLNVYCLVLCQ
ncbi:hypothetical protein SDC9_191524 [bioreactor metagenome]|uniref:Uncharacterized protein n=1 Tax=bioreactor metagenome TaxID=1076179 RepID=A0A645I964_9ZZZZ